jgi:hypothetical protein
MGIPWDNTVHDNQVDTRRWVEIRECIFEDGGKYWRISYQSGLTEMQEVDPFEYLTEVPAVEVELKPVTQMSWEPV